MSVRWFIGWFVVHKDEKQLLFPREDPIVPYYLLGQVLRGAMVAQQANCC